METRTTVRYRVPDTTLQRQLIADALRIMRREAELERERWAEFAALMGATR